ncbi:hypothetical protein ACF05L_04685 [Streptomyces bobili]|uniref:hypothetical protein n=1 Tax=Streptomyces bobili TaxID=67280 RepID=UPI0036F8BE70
MSVIAIVFGAIAIPQLGQRLLPTIELPMVSVLAPYQGASPGRRRELRKERRAKKRAAKRQPTEPEKTPEPAGV